MANGEVDVSSAVAINQKFLVGVQWWCWLAEKGILPDTAFIQPANHCTFVHGDDNIHWLKKRVEALKKARRPLRSGLSGACPSPLRLPPSPTPPAPAAVVRCHGVQRGLRHHQGVGATHLLRPPSQR